MSLAEKKILWLVPETKGGIQDYSAELWPFVEAVCRSAGWDPKLLNTPPVSTRAEATVLIEKIRAQRPQLIHIQHEFGLFGSKIPTKYQFPRLLKQLTAIAPCVATAHNVLAPNFQMPWRGRGWQALPRFFLNVVAMPLLRPAWLKHTWGPLAGGIVHSRHQEAALRYAGCRRVLTIPHYVPERSSVRAKPSSSVVVFGFFSPDKGQDIVIRSWNELEKPRPALKLAGGARRPEDQSYLRHCEKLIRNLKLESDIKITGYVPAEEVDALYAEARLVVAPFRETSGSGSITQAFARGVPVLASDLLLNQELNERSPGCLEFFQTANHLDCAEKIKRLLKNSTAREELARQGAKYASLCRPEKIASAHLEFYRTILS